MSDNTAQRQAPCPIWVWIVLLLGLVLLFLVYHNATSKKAVWIQQDINERTALKIHNMADLKSVIVNTDGRDVTLSSTVSSTEAVSQAEQIARQVLGTRIITNQISVVEDSSTSKPPADSSQSSTLESFNSSAKVEPLPDEFLPLEESVSEGKSNDEHALEKAQAEEAAKEQFKQLDFSNITFEKNSAALTDVAKNTLDGVVSALQQNPLVNILVNGHTDSSGRPELNLKISQQRAQSVLEYLVEAGVASNRIKADGFGDQFPIAPNDTKAGRIKNRRIEIKVENGE